MAGGKTPKQKVKTKELVDEVKDGTGKKKRKLYEVTVSYIPDGDLLKVYWYGEKWHRASKDDDWKKNPIFYKSFTSRDDGMEWLKAV